MPSLSLVPQTPLEITQRRSSLDESAVPGAQRAPTFALYTLGCKVNQYDSHQIARALLRFGFRRVEFRECADLYVIDTCTVTAEADRKSRKAAGRARRNNPEAVIAITGCAAAYAPDQFRQVAGDALVLSNARKLELPELALRELQKRADWAENYALIRAQSGSEPLPGATRERAVLKIQDGCNHRCAFCIIPTVRGASQIKSRTAILSEARAFVHEGARELTVTGVSLGDWAPANAERGRRSAELKDARSATLNFEPGTLNQRRGRNHELCELLRALTTIEGLERLRVSSIDAADADEEFLQTVANTPLLCPHIHLALQGGGAATLRRMKRRYTPEGFLKVARRWRELRPDGALTTDIIVGFPGETDEDFEASLRLAREARFSAIHVFPFSPRAGTAAADLPDRVPPDVQNRRVDALLSLAKELSAQYAAQFIGQDVPVLVESVEAQSGIVEGMTPHYLKARFRSEDRPQVGDIVWMQTQSWRDGALNG